MSWIEVRATLPPVSDTSPFIEIFREFGIENTLEEGSELVGCQVETPGAQDQISRLSESLSRAGALGVVHRPFEEQNWAEVWKQFFHPRRVGGRFVVRPTWETCETRPDDLVIVLDPGEAFGTGDHATTRLCLELLEAAVPRGGRVADVGCGSGILSIGACLLGAREVDAVDVDAISVEVAKSNAALNEVTFDAIVGDGIAALRAPYDVVVSNIISAVLMRMAPEVAVALVPGGQWIVSGILLDNWPLVLSAAERAGFSLVETVEEGDWAAGRFTH